MTHPIVRYFDDYAPDVTFDCGSVTVDEASIIAFAKDYDPQPFHLDPAAGGPFGGLTRSKPDRGIVRTLIEALNQVGSTVLRLTAINFVLVRPAS